MKTTLRLLLMVALTFTFALAQKGEGEIDPSPPKGITVEEIIQRFAAKEKEFALARENYIFRQDVTVQTLEGNSVDGEYRQVVDVTFDDKGRRVETVVFAPQSTLQRVSMSRADFDDIEKRLPFVLTTDDLPQYNVTYVGKQRVDELDTYVFDVAPKTIEKNKRYFDGRIWVDDRDFQIVKTFGKNVPDTRKKDEEDLSPRFTTYREQIDGKYWFPTYTRADDTLAFSNGDVRIRLIVKYTNYMRFGTEVKTFYEGQEIGTEGEKKPEEKKPPK